MPIKHYRMTRPLMVTVKTRNGTVYRTEVWETGQKVLVVKESEPYMVATTGTQGEIVLLPHTAVRKVQDGLDKIR